MLLYTKGSSSEKNLISKFENHVKLVNTDQVISMNTPKLFAFLKDLVNWETKSPKGLRLLAFNFFLNGCKGFQIVGRTVHENS